MNDTNEIIKSDSVNINTNVNISFTTADIVDSVDRIVSVAVFEIQKSNGTARQRHTFTSSLGICMTTNSINYYKHSDGLIALLQFHAVVYVYTMYVQCT